MNIQKKKKKKKRDNDAGFLLNFFFNVNSIDNISFFLSLLFSNDDESNF